MAYGLKASSCDPLKDCTLHAVRIKLQGHQSGPSAQIGNIAQMGNDKPN